VSEDVAGEEAHRGVGRQQSAVMPHRASSQPQAIAHYRVIRPIGAGGMGEVYLAEDARLGRKVALKILPAHFTTQPERVRRFELEARAASALNHPNILTIYDIGHVAAEGGSVHYIATEYVEGRTLRERLRESPMPCREAVEVAAQVALALAASHAAGVTHRDIKPDNVMLRPDGYVKVLDFGLAKLTEPSLPPADREGGSAARAETEPGLVMGTVSYMSPEQARGLKVDHRSDIFSLGVVLYEMVAGRVPFAGVTMSDVLAALLRAEHEPLARRVAEAPAELDRIVARALCKDCAARYQKADDLLADLTRLKRRLEFETEQGRLMADGAGEVTRLDSEMRTLLFTPSGGAGQTLTAPARRTRLKRAIDSLAVLPFVNAGTDADAEYLSDGITESLINGLAQLPKLRLVPRSTVFRVHKESGGELDPQAVGREFGVRAVLTGRVEARGEWLIIKAELIDVVAERQVWGEHYRRKLTNIFTLQEEIAKEISAQLRLRLGGRKQRRLVKRYTENAEAYQLYLKGRYYAASKRTEEWIRKGIEHFQRAIDLDPNYALAYAGMADAYSFLASSTGGWAPREAYPKARAAALKALELDESLGEAHCALGFYHLLYDWNVAAAEREFRRAIELNPDYGNAHDGYAFYLKAVGRSAEAISECEQLQQLDPLSPFAHVSLGWAYYFARDFERAVEQGRKALELDPQSGFAHRIIGLGCGQLGRHEEAVAALQKALDAAPGVPLYVAHLGHAYALAGEVYGARRALGELGEMARRQYVSAYYFALVHLGLGRHEEVFEWLEKAYEERAGFLVYLKVEPLFDALRADARFAGLLRRVGREP
jgi:eukaryotic-like serine/threonine-protein kinase